MTLRAYRGGIASMATLIPAGGTSADKPHAELRTLITSSRQRRDEAFPGPAIVSTLSTKLSLSHLVAIVALKSPNARQFYAQHAAMDAWSVRELNQQIERKAFERTELATLQAHTPVQTEAVVAADTDAAQVFKDPYFLDFLVTTCTPAKASNSPCWPSRA